MPADYSSNISNMHYRLLFTVLLRPPVLNYAASGMELLKMWFFSGLCDASIFDIGLKLHFCGTQHAIIMEANGKNPRKLSKKLKVMVQKQQIIVPTHFQLWTEAEFAELFILNFRNCHRDASDRFFLSLLHTEPKNNVSQTKPRIWNLD